MSRRQQLQRISSAQKWFVLITTNGLLGTLVYFDANNRMSLTITFCLFNLLFLVSDRVFAFRGSRDGINLSVQDAVGVFEATLQERGISPVEDPEMEATRDRVVAAAGGEERLRILLETLYVAILQGVARRQRRVAPLETFRTRGLSSALDTIFPETADR